MFRVAQGMAVSFLIIFLHSQMALGQENQCKVNGCGPSGILGRLVVDRSYFTECEFEVACNNHDRCYSNCQDCGPLFGTDSCKKSRLCVANPYKYSCDTALYSDISNANANRATCRGFAAAYTVAVLLAGCMYYDGQTFSPQQVEMFQKNFDAILKYYEHQAREKKPFDMDELAITIQSISALGANNENIFKFDAEAAEPRLRFEAIKPLPDSPVAWHKLGVKRQRLLNGIDVTNARVGDQAFDFNDVAKELPDLAIGRVIQTDQFVPDAQ